MHAPILPSPTSFTPNQKLCRNIVMVGGGTLLVSSSVECFDGGIGGLFIIITVKAVGVAAFLEPYPSESGM
jgi:hypothetical protein